MIAYQSYHAMMMVAADLLRSRMYEKRPGARLVVSVEVRRRAPRYGSNKGEFEEYPLPYARYFLMGADGAAHAL